VMISRVLSFKFCGLFDARMTILRDRLAKSHLRKRFAPIQFSFPKHFENARLVLRTFVEVFFE
jgi:hypothetical protein